MAIRNRELSQFGSFIYIDDSTRSVGIATTSTPYVGIGTANPTAKLEVAGNTKINGTTTIVGNMSVSGTANIAGVVSASSYYLNGTPLVSAATQTWSSSGSDVYQLGNVGIGTSVFTEKLTVVGNVSAERFISTATNGTSPFQVTSQTLVTNLNSDYLRGGIPGSNINSYDIVTLGAQQTLTNKTLTLPVFTGLGVTFNGSTSGNVRLTASPVAGGGTLLLPTTSGTLVSTGDTGVVTRNMITSLSITNSDIASGAAIAYSKLNLSGSITNSDIASGASIALSKLAASTISGISLGNNLNSLTAGSYINYSSGTTYNGSSAITVSIAATTTNTANTIVARDASGDFTAGTVSVTNLTASQTIQAANSSITQLNATNGNFSGIVTATSLSTGTMSVTSINITQLSATNGNFSGIVTAVNGNFSGIVTATDFNSTSDITLKENIHTVENSLETVQSLRGVSFDWKETGKKSYGVIAQELEEILPELVTDGEIKTVNYNGIIGVLIEAVKELKAEIEDLKNSK